MNRADEMGQAVEGTALSSVYLVSTPDFSLSETYTFLNFSMSSFLKGGCLLNRTATAEFLLPLWVRSAMLVFHLLKSMNDARLGDRRDCETGVPVSGVLYSLDDVWAKMDGYFLAGQV
jgi:hypothetical protein